MKINLICNFFTIVLIITLFFLTSSLFENQNEKNRRQRLSQAVDVPYSLAESMENDVRKSGNVYREESKNDFLAILDKIRYGKNSFFFVIDGSGRMIHHPLYPELSWWNMNFETDEKGDYLFREIIENAKRDGEFYRETVWQSKFRKDINEPQIIYGKYLWSWDWLICTVLYESEMTPDLFSVKLYFIITAILLVVINTFLYFYYNKKS